MNITAKEVGRSLVLTLGGPADGMDDLERDVAARDVRRIVVPPVDAETGIQIWRHYARILFNETDESAETTAVEMTQLALGARAADDASEEDRARAAAQWAAIEALRWGEAELVCQVALYWNAQGGGIEAVEAMLRDGHPKAQEILLTRNQLWNVYSRLRMLTPSPGSGSATETPSPDGSTATNTPSGSSEPDARDAFGIRQAASAR